MTTGLAQFVKPWSHSIKLFFRPHFSYKYQSSFAKLSTECSVLKNLLKVISDGSLIKGMILSVADWSDDDAITMVSISALKVERSTSHLDIYLF